MDAVMFEMKGAHLALQRFGRGMLREFGITPARFDLMHALGHGGARQAALWRRLRVVRSVVCEMVRALARLGWVERERDPDDRRTWRVKLTELGRAVFERAYARGVESGDATLHLDAALAQDCVDIDALQRRTELVQTCEILMLRFRTAPSFHAPTVYPWDPEDYYHYFADPSLAPGPGELPFV